MTHLSDKQRATSISRSLSLTIFQPYSSMRARSRPVPQLPGKYYLSDAPRLPPMPDNKERAAKPAAGHLVQQMSNRAYKQRGGRHAQRHRRLLHNRPPSLSKRSTASWRVNRNRRRPCPLRRAEAVRASTRMPCEHGQRDVCCRPWAYSRHPFCQDEKTRLPAEILRLDSRTICFLEFEPPDFCSSFRPSSTMNQLRKAAFESDRKSSHWGRFPMGRFFASASTYT